MFKKRLAFVFFALISMAAVALLAACSNSPQAQNSPYGSKRLHPETIQILNDPLYRNIILPDELAQRLAAKEELFVYFFSPACPHCKETTPVLVPVANEMGVDLKMYNVLEYEQGWKDYNIEGTPTLVHFVDGKERSRIVGSVGADAFREWFSRELGK